MENLEHFVNNKSFKESANAIAASNDILEHFCEYRHVTQINDLFNKKMNLCSKLLALVLDEFKNYINLSPNNSEILYEACLAINAIGDDAIKSLKTWFTQYKLSPYEELFDPKSSDNSVEFKDSERRFEWLKRTLKEYNQNYDCIFPQSWGFKSQICQDFCRITKLHINEMLMANLEEDEDNFNNNPNNKKNKIDVDVLVRVLNNTINFENNLHIYLINEFENFNGNNNNNKGNPNVKIGIGSNNKNQLSLNGITNTNTNEENNNNNTALEEIKAKYDNRESIINPYPDRYDPNDSPKYKPFRVKGLISESFDPYMISYVQIEEKKLKDLIDSLKQNDKIEGKLYVSSLHLFNNIKQAMNRCLTFSKSKTFFDLSKMFKEIFKYYTDSILNINKVQKFKELSKDFIIKDFSKEKERLSEEEIKHIAYIINTCDYCITTINALIESLKNKIEEKYKSQIFYDDVLDYLKKSYKLAFDVIVNWIKSVANENFYIGLVKGIWTNVKEDDFSPYLNNLGKQIAVIFDNITDIIAENFCYHILNSLPKIITESFLMNFFKIKKVDESGSEKMLMDMYEIREIVVKIYNKVNSSHGNNKGISNENDFNWIW